MLKINKQENTENTRFQDFFSFQGKDGKTYETIDEVIRADQEFEKQQEDSEEK